MDEKKEQQIMEKLINQTIVKVEKNYDVPNSIKRNWLKTNLDSYEDSRFRIELHVREGSPCKGYILIDRRNGIVRGYNIDGKQISYKSLTNHIDNFYPIPH
jgi:hypothetical protein